MKSKLVTPLLLASALLALPACQNPEKAVAIGKVGLDLLVKHDVLSSEDAAAALEIGQIAVTPTPDPATAPEASGK